MELRRRARAIGAAAIAVTAAGMGAAGAAQAAGPSLTVATLSSAPATAAAGHSYRLHGQLANQGRTAGSGKITVRLMRYGVPAHVVGTTTAAAAPLASSDYSVPISIPTGLPKGTYYLSACTPDGQGHGQLGCATAATNVQIGGGTPLRGPGAVAKAADAGPACSSGAHTLSAPGSVVYPETGNGGYTSDHTDVHMVYDTATNAFLPGNHVDQTITATQCLTDFSFDFERTNTNPGGPNLTVGSVEIDGQPASFAFAQPTYPGDPNGQDDPNPAAHLAGINTPVNAANPVPPACSPAGTAAALQGQPCPANKLVITPSAPIAAGTTLKVTIDYTGTPGVHVDGDGSTEGWFRSNNPVGDGGFVTTEPVGTEDWLPLNDYPTAKPSYDFYDEVPLGKTGIGNGRLVSDVDDPAGDANFPNGDTQWHWTSDAPVASYLVEDSVGSFDLTSRVASSGTIYYEAQGSSIAPAQKTANLAVMDQQESIVDLQSQFNGPWPFSTDGVIVGIPTASFEEEMQTKITFNGGKISIGTFSHENMHQWWGDNVSEGGYRNTFYKEGYATLGEYIYSADVAGLAAGAAGSDAYTTAFDASLVNQFNANYGSARVTWTQAPNNPTAASLFSNSPTYTRPGTAYIALRQILGNAAFVAADEEIQSTYGGGSVTEPQLETIFQKHLPVDTAACHAKLAAFFTQWWDTAYPAGQKPTITGPGLAGQGFYDADGGCSDYAVGPITGTVAPTLSLTLGSGATFGNFTPGIATTYSASQSATVLSTAGDAALSVSDPDTTQPGHLVNGAYSLGQPLQVDAASAGGSGGAFAPLGAAPLALESWSAPVTDDQVTIGFQQQIGATQALRTGNYSKTLTFTLSTTTP